MLSWHFGVGCFSELRCVHLPEPSAVMNGLMHFNSKSYNCKGKVLRAVFHCSECAGSQGGPLGQREGGREVITSVLHCERDAGSFRACK